MKVSVIIPVYNIPQQDLTRCFRSLTDQRFRDFEAIVVDDGSKPEHAEVCRKACEADPRFRYIRIENQGVSHARNTGIDLAGGEYLAFTDADDTVSADFLEHAVKYAEENQADAVIGRIRFLPERTAPDQRMDIMTVTEDRKRMMEILFSVDNPDEQKALGSPCGRIYRSTVAKKIRFDENLRHFEDQIYNRRFMGKAGKCVFVPEDWYCYYQNDYSAQHKHRKWDQLDGLSEFWDVWETMNEMEENAETRKMFEKKGIIFFHYIFHEGILAGEKYNRKRITALLDQPVFQRTCKQIRTGDCRSLPVKGMLFLMKHRMTLALYCGEKLVMRMNHEDGRTVQMSEA